MRYRFYTANEIKPCGWLRRQLIIQAEGLSGNLDKVWRDVRDSAWIGGDAEGWERVPYWLDGFIPLAYLLEDEDMISRAKRYIDAILSFQKDDGWLCPCADDERAKYDSWAVELISKVLVVYYECSGDERIPTVLKGMMNNYYDLLKNGEIKLFDWGRSRWFEAFIALNFLKEAFDEEWIDELAEILRAQGADYESLADRWVKPLNKWTQETHIVNLAMMLKTEAVCGRFFGDDFKGVAERLRDILYLNNGTPVELFTGDECLSGLSPIQGTELCAVVEQMYSYEWLFAATGDRKWAERLEVLAFNALPAALSDDMWTHQYDQMSNQIACVKLPGRAVFRTNNGEAHLFGLEPNFGCCTANFNQGWPKLALSVYMHSGNEITAALMLPSVLKDGGVTVICETDYPFKNSVHYKISSDRDITFTVRIPSFAKGLTVDGKATDTGDISAFVASGEERTLDISFSTEAELISRPHDLFTAKSGSLIYSLPIKYSAKMYEYEKKGVERKYPYCDYEYIPKSDWSFGFSSEALVKEENGVSDIPFSSELPPCTLEASVTPILWGLEDGFETVCAKLPESRDAVGKGIKVKLYPYGSAKLRMTELPLLNKENM